MVLNCKIIVLWILIFSRNETEVYVDEYELDYIEGEDGLYNVSAILYYNPENLTNTFYYICELYIPGTSYELKEKRSYSLGNFNFSTSFRRYATH